MECSVVAQTYPHIKRGSLRDFKKIMEMTGRWFPNRYNKSSSTYEFLNGSKIEFFSVDNESRIR